MKLKSILLAPVFLLLVATVSGNKSSIKGHTAIGAKTLSYFPGGYNYELYIGGGRYEVHFNEDLSYVAEVIEYYTGTPCTNIGYSVNLITDDYTFPVVDFSVSFVDPNAGPFGTGYYTSLSDVTLRPWAFI